MWSHFRGTDLPCNCWIKGVSVSGWKMSEFGISIDPPSGPKLYSNVFLELVHTDAFSFVLLLG